jgi:hypothetical protein
MKSLLTVSLLAATASAAIVYTGDLAQRFEKGQVLTTTISMESATTLEESATLVNGNEMPMPAEMTSEANMTSTISFTDKVLRASDSQLSAFQRTYTEAGDSRSTRMVDPMGGDHSGDIARVSQLIDIPILFERGDDGFEASFPEDSEGDDDWLDGLLATPDWNLLLPEETPKIGDEWEVSVDLLKGLREPGGDIAWEVDGEATGIEGEVQAPPGITDYEGEISAKLVEIEDGVATIEFELEVSSETDLTDYVTEDGMLIGDEDSGMPTPEMEALIIETESEGSGVCYWDMEAGRMNSLILEIESEETQTVVMALEMGGQSMDIESISTSRVVESIEIEIAAE